MAAPTISLIDPITSASQAIETNTRAARVSLYPNDVGLLGSYRKALFSGVVAAGAGTALVYAFRWAPTPTGLLCVPKRVAVGVASATAFAPGVFTASAFFASSYTVIDSTGAGTNGTFTGHNGKLKSTFPVSAGATCSIVNTSALSGGTSTLDTDAFGIAMWEVTTAGATVSNTMQELYRAMPGDWPLVFANNEGFQIKTTVPATGTWSIAVDVAWDERLSYGAASAVAIS